MKRSFKQWQMNRNILDACAAIDMYISTNLQHIQLLMMVLPVGWRLSKKENNHKFIERDLQATENDIFNVYMAIKNNRIHIHQYFTSTDKNILTIRLNVIVDDYDRIQTI